MYVKNIYLIIRMIIQCESIRISVKKKQKFYIKEYGQKHIMASVDKTSKLTIRMFVENS